MNPRFRRLGLVVGCTGIVLAGCETLHSHGLRGRDEPSIAQALAPEELEGFEEEAEAGRGFFKSSRLRGALSSEGAEVERHLGIQ